MSFPNPIRTIEGITEYKLTNGLSVLLFPDTSAQNVVVNLTYLVGSRHEGRGEAGMAHLLEHMLFKGTPTHPNVMAQLQDRGAIYNATTSFDRTNYFEILTASDENLDFALKLEADRMINSWIRQEDLDSEMTVVRNEFEMGENNPLHVLHDQMFSAAYRWHNYGKTTIGNRSDIERVPVQKLVAFYQHYYQPDNAVLIVAGNFKTETAQKLILQYFGKLAKPSRILENTYTEEPTQDGVREVKLMRSGDVAQAGLAYHIPAASHPDFRALMVLSEVLSDEPSGLLYQSLVQAGLASELFSLPYALKEPGLFMIFARPTQNEEAAKVLQLMIKRLENLGEEDITAERVERAKTRILKNIQLSMKKSKSVALMLSEAISQGDYRLLFYTRDQVKMMTADDVLAVAGNYFVESNRTTGLFLPMVESKRAAIPPTPDVEAMLEGYCSSEEIHLGEAFEASAENIDAHTSRDVLVGTIKTAILPKSTRGKANQARAIFRFGSEESLLGKQMCLALLPSLLSRGSKNRSFQQLHDTLDTLQSSLNIYAAQPGVAVMSMTSDYANLQPVIELSAEMMREPLFSQEEFLIVKQRELANLKEARFEPSQVGMRELNRLMNPFPQGSIHYIPTIDEKIAELEKLSLEMVHQLYLELYGANHMEFALVGDFDSKVISQVESCYGDWTSPATYKRVALSYLPALNEERILHTPDKQMALVAMGVSFAMRDDDPHYPAMHMANYLFGEGFKSRLMRRLRQKEGLSYGAGSHLEISRHDATASLSFNAICATANADIALKALQEEYQHFLEQGVTEEELLEGKQGFQLYFNNLLANDGFVLNTLGAMIDINRTFSYYTQLLKQTAELTTHDIQQTLEIFLHKAPVATVKAGDFKN